MDIFFAVVFLADVMIAGYKKMINPIHGTTVIIIKSCFS